MTTFDKLADLFRHFPGIGPRQAKRFVYFLLSREPEFVEQLSELARALKREIVQCKECFRYFQKRSGISLCPICADPSRDIGELMVVAKDTDLEAMEKSETYHGKYFVLGGTMPLMETKTAEKLRIRELVSKISRSVIPAKAGIQSEGLREIILALSANTEGEYTSDELRKTITPLLAPSAQAGSTSVKITTLGRGLSTGSELEYADKETLKSALKNRL